MTPKEKADGIYSNEAAKEEAKRFALIAVDEILFEVSYNIKLDWMPERKDSTDFFEYWQQVKTEIDNL